MNYVVDALDRHGIPYAVTGSHASSVFGENRFTNDIDVVIQVRADWIWITSGTGPESSAWTIFGCRFFRSWNNPERAISA
jgi:hypothetical protein